jgi:hypothetical protein
MPDYNRPPTVVTREPGAGGGLYFIVGALVVAVLVGGYFMLGMPGLHTQVAKAPGQKIDVTIQQPAAPAAPAPAPSK